MKQHVPAVRTVLLNLRSKYCKGNSCVAMKSVIY